jgi:hypothetical protein
VGTYLVLQVNSGTILKQNTDNSFKAAQNGQVKTSASILRIE